MVLPHIRQSLSIYTKAPSLSPHRWHQSQSHGKAAPLDQDSLDAFFVFQRVYLFLFMLY